MNLAKQAFHPADLADTGVSPALLQMLITEHQAGVLPRLQRFWDYYRNPSKTSGTNLPTPSPAHAPRLRFSDSAPHSSTLAQAQGLPPRLHANREIVIENDIAWRIHTLVDFMFAKGVVIQSMSDDDALATRIETLLREVFDHNGGQAFFHDLALLGGIYGYVDVLLRLDPATHRSPNRRTHSADLRLDLVDPPRAIPLLDPDDYRRIDTFILHYGRVDPVAGGIAAQTPSRWHDLLKFPAFQAPAPSADRLPVRQITEVISPQTIARFQDGQLIDKHLNRLGRVPAIHFQNLPLPFFYEGLSDVEPLIPLQDELNTRLSDRANRVTFQSFKMYLGKGIERFVERPVGPGQMWQTENPDASIQEFGGDAASPSEDAHIEQIRDAMDKTSGVNGIAAGLLRDKVGNLTSENALRMVLVGLLAKTEKRRVTYGAGIARLCELILHAADVTGLLATRPEDRRVRLDWPSPLPENTGQRLEEAKLKLELGVPRLQVLAELGYAGDV